MHHQQLPQHELQSTHVFKIINLSQTLIGTFVWTRIFFYLFTVKSIIIWPGTGTGSVRIVPEKEMGAPAPPVHKKHKKTKHLINILVKKKFIQGNEIKLPQLARPVIFTDLADAVATRRAATIKNFILLVNWQQYKGSVDLSCASTKHEVSQPSFLYYFTLTSKLYSTTCI